MFKILSLIWGSLKEIFSVTKRSYNRLNGSTQKLSQPGMVSGIISLFLNIGIFIGIFVIIYFVQILPSTNDIVYDRIAGQNISVKFLDRNGVELGQRGIKFDDSLPFEEYPQNLINAVLATEDRRFFEHFGVDFLGTGRALVSNIQAKGIVQGGSTITQQLVKNLFLSPERTLNRKIKEAILSVWIESKLEKEEIMKLYLDRSYMGAGVYGVVEGAQSYFGKKIKDITLVEAALIAGVLKAPSKYAPHVSKRESLKRTEEVISNMYEAGFITKKKANEAIKSLSSLKLVNTIKNTEKAGYFLDWAFNNIKDKIDDSGNKIITVRTSLDINLQLKAEQILRNMLRKQGKRYRVKEGAIITLAKDGAVLAMVGGKNYNQSQFNRAVNSNRQPGSSFKPVVYLTALNNGYNPNTILIDQPYRIGKWEPRNYTRRYRGTVSLTDALTYSINSIPVAIAKRFGLKPIMETGKKLGLEVEPYYPSVLGTSPASLIDLTSAYSVFANEGIKTKPYAILKVYDVDENEIEGIKDDKINQRIFEVNKISQLNYMLKNVVKRGTGRGANFATKGYLAGKTGTTQSYRDAWFMGYSSDYVTGVWFGNDDFSQTKKMTGGSLPALTWREVMAYAHNANILTAKDKLIASNQFVEGDMVSINANDLTNDNDLPIKKKKNEKVFQQNVLVRNVERKKTKVANKIHSHFLEASRR